MKLYKPDISIALVEDSKFFNGILTKQLEDFGKFVKLKYNFEMEVFSYLKSTDFILDLREELDIVFTDFYLEHGTNAYQVLKAAQKYCAKCKVVVVSQARNLQTANLLNCGADKYIMKDKDVFFKLNFYLENYIRKKLSVSY